ncbi:D-2-hydroxyacid dehydrogenase [Aeromonas simiae]|uniref:D-2-hydroxyacid dehydrogenase n=1 Tax=Aeromonas simiae TaxID=218936 RepID=UPI0005AA17AA|nr:D-2-hydroxyacid dehydrogenase [Aeromonas simiae]MDO2950244.1 D-2-hydroxyacid dehydrogenase [Aeromonas simiae]MDO2953828.1 D-2-hydroxyacid dehydrogenase [Aeromonas simiae]MDO2957665.1 D-2-hydroxyacid dehydrogenase [Aeromonas simiae]
MSQRTLLLLSQDNAHYERLLKAAHLPHLRILRADSDAEAKAKIGEAHILMAEPARARPLLAQASKLVWLQSTYAGVDILLGPGERRDYQLTNVRGIFGPLMSEYVFGHLLALTRQIVHYREQQRQKVWQSRPYESLRGKTLLILGTGSIGQHIAQTGHHFGMQVLGVSRSGRERPGFTQVYQVPALNKVLPQADVIVSVLPSTRETRHLFNAERFSYCKPSAIFFNVGRGSAVDSTALLTALRTGKLGFAVLDVFEQEPLPADSPLWGQPNLTITPHNSAYSFPEDVAQIFIRNYIRFIDGQPMDGKIDFDKGY